MNPEAPIKNLFTGDALAAGQGGIIGVIFAVWLLSIVEKNYIKLFRTQWISSLPQCSPY